MITYSIVNWDILPVVLADGWELETFNEQKQEALIYKMGQHELDADGAPAIVGKPEPKPRPPAEQPPMRKQ